MYNILGAFFFVNWNEWQVEEGCVLSSVDDIAAAVHHMLRIIEEEAQTQAAPLY